MVLIGNENLELSPKTAKQISLGFAQANDFHSLYTRNPNILNESVHSKDKDSFLLSSERRYLNMDTFILCNPNAMSYQHMINYPHAYYLKYFLSKQINVFVWNYRGYGRTKGTPSPQKLCQDAEQVLYFLRSRIGIKGKIGIYGRSLGCIAASHLQHEVSMMIADRGFCDLWTLAERKFHGKLALEIFKFFSFGWQACNSFHYLTVKPKDHRSQEIQNDKLHPTKCYKVIIQDQKDEIVDFQSSLLVGAARECCMLQAKKQGLQSPKYLTDSEAQNLISSVLELLSLEDKIQKAIEYYTENAVAFQKSPMMSSHIEMSQFETRKESRVVTKDSEHSVNL